MSEQNINLNQLGTLVNAINLAQKRGAYSLQEAAQLAEPVLNITRLLEDLARQQAAATEGAATEGAATEGAATEGAATEGAATEGAATEGAAAPAATESTNENNSETQTI